MLKHGEAGRTKTFIFFFALMVIVGCGGACAAEADGNAQHPVANPFSAPIDTMSPRITIGGEDLASPFTEAHNIEQSRYQSLYYAHYHGIPPGMRGPMPPLDLPSAIDGDGHQLWFDGTQGASDLGRLVTDLFGRGQFDDLEHLFDDWNNPAERLADGRWKLGIFERAINAEFGNISDWDRVYEYIQKWRQAVPKSRAAALIEAVYWRQYAWNARGNGFVNSVASDGWQLFRQRLAKAEAVLHESEPYASTSPLWGRIYIGVERDLERPKEELLQAFDKFVEKQKNFEPLYLILLKSLVPKWGGSWQIVDGFVRGAVKITQDSEGYSMYARLYWEAFRHAGPQFELFRDTRATWPEMKRGFEDLVRAYPHSAFNLNNYAAAACMAGDKETFQSLRFRIGKYVTLDSWPSNYSLDLCEHRFATQGL